MTIPYDREVLVGVLVYHWRTNTSGCGCGWAELGKSHAEHVAAIYEESVILWRGDDAKVDLEYQHASCACVNLIGRYPLKSLCGLLIANHPPTNLPKCPTCLELYGQKPCVLCPPDCEGC